MKLKFRIINVLTSNKGGNFYVWKVYVLHIYITIIIQQRETTTAQKWLCCGGLACFVNIANYTVLCTGELSVREQITCKWIKMTASCPTNTPPSQALNKNYNEQKRTLKSC